MLKDSCSKLGFYETNFFSGIVHGSDYSVARKKCGDKGTIGKPCSKTKYIILQSLFLFMGRF
jgi:hypothetical protein